MDVEESEVPLRRPDYIGRKRPYRPQVYRPVPREKQPLKPFIAWDGEGYTDETGEHHYMLFGNSEGGYVMGESLSHIACFELLLNTAATTKGIHVIFAGGYDMVMMIRRFDPKKCERILKSQVTWVGDYRIEYFKGKYLKLSHVDKRSVTLYDVFTFFSTSFVRACKEYLGDNPDFDRIAETKLLRDSFRQEDVTTLVLPYMRQELKYLVELCTILRKRMNDADIWPSQWHGPGAVAGAVLKQRGIKAHKAITPVGVQEAARCAYFGGRFEQFKMGLVQGPVYQYDIRSAYPYAITRLPSLASIRWRHKAGRTVKRFNSFGLYRISYQANDNVTLLQPGPLPWRDTGRSIYYPHDNAGGWYWGIELSTVSRISPGTITVLESWEPSSDPVDFPFRWVGEMYDNRARMKREGNPTQLALKLAMNSLYGKLAQSKGAKFDSSTDTWKLPAYHQLEWAGWITAATRAKLYEAMVQAGNSLIAVETDAVYSTKPLDLPCSPNLGDWEEEISSAILYIQSGVYFKQESDGTWKLKSRGFEPRGHTYEAWQGVMSRLPDDDSASVTINLRRFGSIPGRQTFARWYEMERTTQILQSSSKRIHMPSQCVWCDRGHNMIEFPHDLALPSHLIAADSIESQPHQLPWIERERYIGYNDEWVITEEGYADLEMQVL